MTTLLELVGLSGTSGLELIFGISALIGGLLFLIWFVLMMVGGAVADIGGEIFGADIGLDTDLSFKALTFQGISAFTMMFGLIGLAIMRSTDNTAYAIIGGTISGTASMWVIGKLFEGFMMLQAEGTVRIEESIGARGKVYLRIPKGGTGQVQVTFQGQMRTMDATSEGGVKIDTGEFIEVVDIIAGTLLVKRYSSSSEVPKARDAEEEEAEEAEEAESSEIV
jgi:membrane protein implicated in regulation of membrane protease activity